MIDKDLCVKDLKLFKPHHIGALFGDEDSIVMLRADLLWEAVQLFIDGDEVLSEMAGQSLSQSNY